MNSQRRIAVVTGTRAEYGLLRTVIDAIQDHPSLDLKIVVAGMHLLPEVNTIQEIRAERCIDAEVPMQRSGLTGRHADSLALGRGVQGFAEAFHDLRPDVVLALGDRIEVFAAACAASVGGICVAHMHGGDRAMGVADEAMRHAVTKLAHIHLPATVQSAERIEKMGEPHESIVLVGSPAVDHIDQIDAMGDEEFFALGSPKTIFLMHGVGDAVNTERQRAAEVLEGCVAQGAVLALAPNLDPGSVGIRDAIEHSSAEVHKCEHLSRERFIAALHRVDALVGNSSAGLIEAAVIGCPAINVGERQGGRERTANVMDLRSANTAEICNAIDQAGAMPRSVQHPYGDGRCGESVAEVLADFQVTAPLRKRNSY